MKYIVVTGGVMSGLGKGITAASIGRLLKNRDYGVTAVKIDPYLNIDAGTMNPSQHGEVFVLNDGAEVDLDLGNYERFLDINLSAAHNITTGKVYQAVIEKERRGDFLGETVQIIPHITDQIKEYIRSAAKKEVIPGQPADICLVEIGGTVGDIEGMPFLEAIRQMHNESIFYDIVLVHVTLAPVDTMDGHKTKPTQHSVKTLRELGLHPDIIVCRSESPIGTKTRKKISLFCDVPLNAVISAATVSDIYHVPMEMENEGLADVLISLLNLKDQKPNRAWYGMVNKSYTSRLTIAIVSKYGFEDVYISIKEALKHAGRFLSTEVVIKWVDAEKFCEKELTHVDGIIVPGGFGKRGIECKLKAIHYARIHGKPFLGLCLGFQLAVIEFARNVLGWEDATSEELGSGTYVIALLQNQKEVEGLGGTMQLGACEISIKPETLLHRLYEKTTVIERHRHRYEVNPVYTDLFEQAGLIFSGLCGNRMEVCELSNHPFFLATQFHPEFTSRLVCPSPPFVGFVKACYQHRLCINDEKCSAYNQEKQNSI